MIFPTSITQTDPNKLAEAASWRKISKAADIEVETCMRHWKILKNSAKYYSVKTKIPYKSGASTDEVIESASKYQSEWPYKDLMGFYTPPNQRASSSLVSMVNVSASTSAQINDLPDVSLVDEDSSCYVRILLFLLLTFLFN